MINRTESNFWLAVANWVGLLLTTGTGIVLWRFMPYPMHATFLGQARPVWLAAHVIAAAVGLAGVVLHVIGHWGWLKALRGRRLGTMPPKLRANRLVDRAMWMCFIAANVWGALAAVLRLGEASQAISVPERLHVAFGVAWTVLTIVHLGLHKQWITTAARRCVSTYLKRVKAPDQRPAVSAHPKG